MRLPGRVMCQLLWVALLAGARPGGAAEKTPAVGVITCQADLLVNTWKYPPVLHTVAIWVRPGQCGKAMLTRTVAPPGMTDPLWGKVGLTWLWRRDGFGLYVPALERATMTPRSPQPSPIFWSRYLASGDVPPLAEYLFGAFDMVHAAGEPRDPGAMTATYGRPAESLAGHSLTRHDWRPSEDASAALTVRAFDKDGLVSETRYSDYRPVASGQAAPRHAVARLRPGGVRVVSRGHETGGGGRVVRTVTFSGDMQRGARTISYEFAPIAGTTVLAPVGFRIVDDDNGHLVADCRFRDYQTNPVLPEGFFSWPGGN